MELRDILGKPGEGVHYRDLFDIAWFDVLGTFMLAFLLLVALVKFTTIKPTCLVTVLCVATMFLLGQMLHLLIGVDTTITLWLRSLFSVR